VTSTSAAAAADDTHCFIFRPTPEWILVYVKCRADEILSNVHG